MRKFLSVLLASVLMLTVLSALASCNGRPTYEITNPDDYVPPEFTKPVQTEPVQTTAEQTTAPKGDNEVDFFGNDSASGYETYENGEKVTLDPDEGWIPGWY